MGTFNLKKRKRIWLGLVAREVMKCNPSSATIMKTIGLYLVVFVLLLFYAMARVLKLYIGSDMIDV